MRQPRPVTKVSLEVLRNRHRALGAVIGPATRRRVLCLFPVIERTARIIHQNCA